MITPRFFIEQEEDLIHIHIMIKYAKISDIEVEIDEEKFWFYLKPYHLQLTFRQKIVSDGREKLRYDVDKGEIILAIGKLNPGENFDDLGLVAKLMEPRKKDLKKDFPLIQPLDDEEEIKYDDHINTGYGFNRKDQGIFVHRQEEMADLFDIDPENTDLDQRFIISAKKEAEDWSVDRYFEDLDLEILQNSFKSLYKGLIPTLTERMEDLSLETLVKLGNKNFILSHSLIQTMFIQLCDLVFVFCLEIRSFQDISCESASNINKISPTLCCLVEFNALKEMIDKISRRFLVYALNRNFSILEMSWEDTKKLFKEGKECILRVLVRIKRIFDSTEPKFLLNRIFVDDFIVWVQKCDGFEEFVMKVVRESGPKIEDVGLDFTFNSE
ncbi:hypothetical protein SteCoe_16006 [Stentor coeruleus]|uniref:CS domain-containing protein n=1 Tax=Stentor coeruleus TaxID=5963 RepID=A0A1R2C293_9CILI|nr:hypothetical protein SteCoe_16006 [Stentor coeruleus]